MPAFNKKLVKSFVTSVLLRINMLEGVQGQWVDHYEGLLVLQRAHLPLHLQDLLHPG